MRERYLIIHMDDMGLCHSANEAGKELFLHGTVTSASIMVPCPWADDFLEWSAHHPEYDVGLHATTTCEWERMRWRPLAGNVPSLTGKLGFLLNGAGEEAAAVQTEDFLAEIETQIRWAGDAGLRATHLDNHMWTAVSRPELLRGFLNLAKRYGFIPHIPAFSSYDETRRAVIQESGCYQVDFDWSIDGSWDCFYRQLEDLPEGLTVLTIHPVKDYPEVRALIPDYQKRVAEYELFLRPETAVALKKSGIRLITWREAADIFGGIGNAGEESAGR